MLFITQESDLKFNSKCVLYFYATWMPFHKKMLLMIDKMEKKYTDIKIFAIDTDYFKNICKRFSIESIPVILMMCDGQELKRINGLIMTSALKHAFVEIYNIKEK
jgi:thioredoxin-like negative regulator of GroEL